MEGYTDTILLDANRRQSIEFDGGVASNNSDYTNKMGTGVKLNPGDKISIHSGYISRRGCGSDTIELTGKSTGKKISLKQSKETNFQKMINPQDYFGLNIPAENYGQVAEVYGCEVIEEETKQYEIKDNEAYFNISYYKTTNGEGYFHLPRRFDALKNQFYDDTALGPTIQPTWIGLFHPSYNLGTECDYASDWAAVSGAIRPAFDCFDMGNCAGVNAPANYDPLTFTTNYYKFAYSSQYRRCLADCHYYQEAQSGNFSQNAGGATGLGTSTAGSGATHPAGQGQTSVFWKKKNDNSRYTLFEKEISYHSVREPRNWFAPNVRATDYNEETGVEIPNNTPSRDDYASVDNTRIHLERRDPALSEYIKHVETKKIGVPEGNYSPGDLASLFTDQLNITQEPKYIVAATAYRGYPVAADPESRKPVAGVGLEGGSSDFVSKQTVVSTVTEATTFKKFHSATSVSIEKKACEDFVEGNSLDPEDASYHRGDEQTAINYLSAYKSIGVKRPELFEAGRKIMKELGYRYIGFNNADGLSLGDYSNIEEFVWADQKPPTTDTDTAGNLHGGELYEDNETNRNLGIANKRKGWSWKQMINPYVVKRINYNDNDGVVITSWNWTQRNLDGLKEFFDVQGKYPELFEGIVLEDSPVTSEATYNKGITNKNARFLHMNKRDSTDSDGFTGTNNWKNKLGTDFMAYTDVVNQVEGQNDNRPDPNVGGAIEGQLPFGSDALFFYFDESRSNTAQGGDTEQNLYYGLFLKKSATNPYSGQTEEFIAITTEQLGGIPEYFFNKDLLDPEDTRFISESQNRTIGFDCHFSAYGTSCIGLYAGYLSGQLQNLQGSAGTSPYYPASVSDASTFASLLYPIGVNTQDNRGQYYEQDTGTVNWSANVKPVHQYIKFRYVGAENPAIVFDDSESKFSFQQLHTPERVGNINNAGQTANNPIVDDTSEKVFFVNKRLLLREFCPDMYPYPRLTGSKVPTGNEQLTTYTSYYNYNITPYSIMDADCGIFIEDFGFEDLTDLEWNLSLWNMLGFTRNQFYSTDQLLTRQTRINNTITTDNIGKPTTNANVEPDDLQQLITNPFGAELRTTQLPVPMQDLDVDNATVHSNYIHFPTATVAQKSAQINAENLPIKTIRPYFLIKSDIITDTKYLGSYESGTSLPIIAVVRKDGADTDFFFGSGDLEFTITNPKTISSIRTQILNPDGTLAQLDGDTSVIYKVVKQNNSSFDVVDQIIQATQPQKKR